MKWDGELYLELHNGTYTTMAEMKNYCRRMEIRFRDLEFVASLAQMLDPANYKYDVGKLRDLWQIFLFDQFHDVLPGTCIGLAYEDTRKNYQELMKETESMVNEAMAVVVNCLIGAEETVNHISKLVQIRP